MSDRHVLQLGCWFTVVVCALADEWQSVVTFSVIGAALLVSEGSEDSAAGSWSDADRR